MSGEDPYLYPGSSVLRNKFGFRNQSSNYVHPFREGNGWAQLQYLDQLAEQAGHPVDLARLRGDLWVTASRAAHDGDYGRMTEEIRRALI